MESANYLGMGIRMGLLDIDVYDGISIYEVRQMAKQADMILLGRVTHVRKSKGTTLSLC